MRKKMPAGFPSETQQSLKGTVIRTVLMAGLIAAVFILLFDHISREHLKLSEKQRLVQLRQLVQIARNTIEPVLEQYRSGRRTREETLTEVRNLVRRMTFPEEHGDNYIFMSSYTGTMLVQPFEPDQEMTDKWHLKDSKGIYIIRRLVESARKEKDGGYVTYHYPPPGRDTPEEKISYVQGIPELECYIGAGRYMGDLRREQISFRWYIIGLESLMLFILLVLILSLISEIWRRNRKLRNEIETRKRSEDKLRASENRYRTLVTNIPGVTYRCACDEHWTMEFFSNQVEKLSGYPASDFIRNKVRSYASIIHPDDRQMVEDAVMRGIRQKKIYTLEYRIIDAGGDLRWIFEKGQGVFDDDGRLLCLDGVIIDITERRHAEDALRKSEAHMRTLINTIPELVWLKDPDGVYLSCNHRFERFFGAKEADIVGKTDHDFVERELADFFREKDRAAMDAGKPSVNEEEVTYADDGHRELLETVKTPMHDSTGRLIGVLGIARDITERKRAAEALEKAWGYIASIINSMPSALAGVDADGRVTLWNRTAEQITGTAAETAKGKPLSDVFPHLAAEIQQISESIRTRQLRQKQKMPRHTETGTRYEDLTIYPLFGRELEGAVIRIDDVTDKVLLEEKIVQSEKMLSVGGLAAGMAHEINNPLAGIMQTADVMSRRLADVDMPANRRAAEEIGISMNAIKAFMEKRGILHMISVINKSGQRMAELIANMVSFIKKGEDAVSSHTPEALIEQALKLAGTDYDLKTHYNFKAIQVKRVYEADIPDVICQEADIQQVILNILRNGAQAMHEAGTESPRFIVRTHFEKQRETAVMEIEDNGPGMDEATRKRVFEPFFTSRPEGDGTGLGLSVSYFIITENHGGEMTVESRPGNGAKFIIRLPIKRQETENGSRI